MMGVFTKAHSFSVTEHTQPLKTIRATELENAQTAPWERDSRWYCIETVGIHRELKARHWQLLMMFLWNYSGPQLTEHGEATSEWLCRRFLMHHRASVCMHCCQLDGCVKALSLVMSYNGNFKRMLAVTYYKQSANMSKHGGNTIWLLRETASDRDTVKDIHGGGNRARAKCGGEKRNATQTQTDVRMCFLQCPLQHVNLLDVQICLPSIQTCKISNV